MRILIHTDEYAPQQRPCAFRMQSFAAAFLEKGHQVTVITAARPRENAGGGERVLYAPSIPLGRKTLLRRCLHYGSFAVTSLARAFRAGPVDIVLTTAPPPMTALSGWLIAVFKRAKLVYDVRDIWPDVAVEMHRLKGDGVPARLLRRLSGFLCRRADLITVVSQGKLEKLNSPKTVLVPNGFDANLAEAAPAPDELDCGPDRRFLCVYTGNIGLAQGLDQLLDLAKAFPEVRFLLFGDGVERTRLEERVRNEAIRGVKFCGTRPQREIYGFLRLAQVSVIPLKSAEMRDSVPTKLYEALGMGCPVLLAAEGDARQLLEETGLGLCVSPDQPEALRAALAELMEDYARFLPLRAETAAYIRRRYDRRKIALELEARLRRL